MQHSQSALLTKSFAGTHYVDSTRVRLRHNHHPGKITKLFGIDSFHGEFSDVSPGLLKIKLTYDHKNQSINLVSRQNMWAPVAIVSHSNTMEELHG